MPPNIRHRLATTTGYSSPCPQMVHVRSVPLPPRKTKHSRRKSDDGRGVSHETESSADKTVAVATLTRRRSGKQKIVGNRKKKVNDKRKRKKKRARARSITVYTVCVYLYIYIYVVILILHNTPRVCITISYRANYG